MTVGMASLVTAEEGQVVVVRFRLGLGLGLCFSLLLGIAGWVVDSNGGEVQGATPVEGDLQRED